MKLFKLTKFYLRTYCGFKPSAVALIYSDGKVGRKIAISGRSHEKNNDTILSDVFQLR